jgi:phosphatidylglycerophosphatase GEP4
VVVGDRIFTDVVLANRMRKAQQLSTAADARKHPGVLAVWTTRVWEKENMLMRWTERKLMEGVQRWKGEGIQDEMARFVRSR